MLPFASGLLYLAKKVPLRLIGRRIGVNGRSEGFISGFSLSLRASPPFRCRQVAPRQEPNVVLERGPVNAFRARAAGANDLVLSVAIFLSGTSVPTFFSFSMWPDKLTFLNDYKVLNADLAKVFAQIEQSYV
jgi:hypothetical protein